MKVTLTTIQPDNCWVVSFKYKSYNQEEAIEVMNSLVKGLNSHGKFDPSVTIPPSPVKRRSKHDEY